MQSHSPRAHAVSLALEPDGAVSCATAALASLLSVNNMYLCPHDCLSRKLTGDVLCPDFSNEGGVHGVAQGAPLTGPG